MIPILTKKTVAVDHCGARPLGPLVYATEALRFSSLSNNKSQLENNYF